uniref:Uncharacterized protein n=1 Tax=Rangifer tarandus platyrhynchus TaxID=3082113 RepID=A0ACB0E7K3_RANTA|nr:unnamed protein product [Rangifer tarandus platyrhynchus]
MQRENGYTAVRAEVPRPAILSGSSIFGKEAICPSDLGHASRAPWRREQNVALCTPFIDHVFLYFDVSSQIACCDGYTLSHGGKMAVQISKKRKFVADGIFKAELNEFLTRELAEDGYSGVEVQVTPTRTEIITLATRTQNVLGETGRRIRELSAVAQKRFGFPEGSVELYAEKIATRGLGAIAQAESLCYKLLRGLAVWRACHGVLRFIMESGAKGCEVVVSGKLRGQRAKSMKFVVGLMIHSGDPVNYYADTAVHHVLLRRVCWTSR